MFRTGYRFKLLACFVELSYSCEVVSAVLVQMLLHVKVLDGCVFSI